MATNEVVASGSRGTMGPFTTWVGTITLSGVTSGAVQVLGKIDAAVVNINSAISHNTHTIYKNTGSGATSLDGFVKIGSGISGDTFDCVIMGRP